MNDSTVSKHFQPLEKKKDNKSFLQKKANDESKKSCTASLQRGDKLTGSNKAISSATGPVIFVRYRITIRGEMRPKTDNHQLFKRQ